jgi:SWI/SNF-related matrix-associated actin-dependent regulator of chromatin subfamily A-like protein 1
MKKSLPLQIGPGRLYGQAPHLLGDRRHLVTNVAGISELTAPPDPDPPLIVPGGTSSYRTADEVVDGLPLEMGMRKALHARVRDWAHAPNVVVFRKSMMSDLRSFSADPMLRAEIMRRASSLWKNTQRPPRREGEIVLQKSRKPAPGQLGLFGGGEPAQKPLQPTKPKAPPKGAWGPIPGGSHGGQRRRAGDHWEYRYPDGKGGWSSSRAVTKPKSPAPSDYARQLAPEPAAPEPAAPAPSDRYTDDEALTRLQRVGDDLYHHQAANPYSQDSAGLSRFDMGQWRRVRGDLRAMRQLLAKYKRQIGEDEHKRLGLAEHTRAAGARIDLETHSRWGSLLLTVTGRVPKAKWNAFLDANRYLRDAGLARWDGQAKVWYLPKDRLAAVTPEIWDAYKVKMAAAGVTVHGQPRPSTQAAPVAHSTPSAPVAQEPTAAEVIERLRGGQPISKTIAVQRDGEGVFHFYSPFSRTFNDVFSNKSGMISGITEYNPRTHARMTGDLSVVEEAIDKLKSALPDWKIVTEGVKEAQTERDQQEAELRKPIPEVAAKLAPDYQLFPYQNEAVRFLVDKGGNALIGDEMGLGKTLQSLAYVASQNQRVLVVVPKVVRRTWIQEAEKFFPDYFKGHSRELVAADIKKSGMPDLSNTRIASINYESLHKFLPAIRAAGFDTIVVDESHRMKSPKAKITKTITALRDAFKHRILLSGTAVKNKKDELHTQAEFIQPGLFSRSELQFGTIGGVWNKLRRTIYIARQKRTVLRDLPEKTTQIAEQRVSGMPDVPRDIGEMSAARVQAALAKAPVTAGFVKEILDSSDSSVLVFSESKEAAKRIAEALGPAAILHHGQMSDDARERAKAEFQREGTSKRVFVSTRQSLAVGATLTAADKVVFNDLPWTAADLRQAEDRAHRVGQRNSVNVYWMTAQDSAWDKAASEILLRKYELNRKLNEGKQLSAEERKWMNTPVSLSEIKQQLTGKPAGPDPIEKSAYPRLVVPSRDWELVWMTEEAEDALGPKPYDGPPGWPDPAALSKSERPSGNGWEPIPESPHGGMRRPVSGGRVRKWEYWYPQGGKQPALFAGEAEKRPSEKPETEKRKPEREQLALFKAAGHKYIKRVPTGLAKPKYRYYYKVPGRRGLVSSDDVQRGAKFKIEHQGQLGHFEVQHHDRRRGIVTVRHDESGKTVHVRHEDLRRMIEAHHGRRTQKTVAERKRAHETKTKAKLHVQPTQARLPGTGVQPREFPEPKRHVPPAAKLSRVSMADMGKEGYDAIEGFSKAPEDLEQQAEAMGGDREFAAVPQAGGFALVSRAKAASVGSETKGDRTEVYLRGTGRSISEMPAQWVVMEAKDLVASHDPLSFTQREDYPVGVQERPYHRDAEEQQKIEAIARDLKPAVVANTNPDAINGAPIVTQTGVVLGGNGRTMGMQRAYRRYSESAAKLKAHLVRHAQAFGLNPRAVAGMKEPVLVRRVTVGGSDEQTRLGRRMNEALTQGLDPRAAEVAVSKFVTQDVVDVLTHHMDADQPLMSFLHQPKSKPFIEAIESAGIIDERNRNQFVNRETGLLNEDGRERVARVLAARMIPDADLLDSMNQTWRENLANAVPYLLQAEAAGWDLRPALKAAVKADAEMQAKGFSRSDADRRTFLAQQSLLDSEMRLPEAKALLAVLQSVGGKKNVLARGFKQVALEADRQKHDHGDQGSMFARPKVALDQAIKTAFDLSAEKKAASLAKSVGAEGLVPYQMHVVIWEIRNLVRGGIAAGDLKAGPLLQRLRAFIRQQVDSDSDFARAMGAHPLDDATLKGLLAMQARLQQTELAKSLARGALHRAHFSDAETLRK